MLTLDVLSCVIFSAMQQLNVFVIKIICYTLTLRGEFFAMVIEYMRPENAAPEHKDAAMNVEN